jgi:hypothetical protein
MGFRSFENSALVISSNADQVAKSSTWIMLVHIIPSIKKKLSYVCVIAEF